MQRRRHVPALLAAALGLAAIAAETREPPQIERILDGDPIIRVLPRGAIPAITDPDFVSAEEADRVLASDEPVLGLIIDGQPKAYSLWQLDHHEVVNDSGGGQDFAVTW
jgi:hypothetical protein